MPEAPTIVAAILWAATMLDLLSAAWKGTDRSRLITAALFALFGLLAARALLPAEPWAAWGWVAATAAYAAVLGRAVLQGWDLPWFRAEAGRWAKASSVTWGAVVVALIAGVLWSLR